MILKSNTSNTFSIRFVTVFIWFHHIWQQFSIGRKVLAMLLQMSEAVPRLESELNCLMCFLEFTEMMCCKEKSYNTILQIPCNTLFFFLEMIFFSIFHSSQVKAGTHSAWERGE